MEVEKDPLEGLTDKQKEDTLNLMQIAHIDQVQVAKQFMEMSNYDINTAVQCYLENGNQPGNQNNFNHNDHQEEEQKQQAPQQHFNLYPNNQNQQQQQMFDMFNQVMNSQNNNNQLPLGVNEEQLNKYKRFLENKKILDQSKSTIGTVAKGVTNVTKSLWNSFIPVALRGESLGGEEFICFIQKKLKLKETYDFKPGGFQESSDKSDSQKRPLLVFIYSDSSPSQQLQKTLLQDVVLKNEFNKSFYCIGILNTSEEAEKLQKYLPSNQWPALAIFRKNLFEQNELLCGITISNQNQDIQYYVTKVKEARSQYYLKVSDDNKIMKAEKQQRRPQFNPFQMDEMAFYQAQNVFGQANDPEYQREQAESRRRLEEERRIKAQQEAEYQQLIKQSEEEENKRQEELAKKEQEQLEEIRKQEEYEEQLKQKKHNLEAEPAEGAEGVIQIAFRIPDGSKIARRFLLSNKPQILFDFIETNGEIKFEGNERQFDLIQTFPQISLLEKKDLTLDEIFDGSDYEQLHVREL